MSQFLRQHMKIQHPDKRIVCCNAIFLTELEYDVHVGRRHTFKDEESQLVTCHLCEKPFKNDSKLVIHLTMDHHNAEPIKCEPCNILFDANHKLALHIRKVHKTDANERIFCEKCPRIDRTVYYNDKLSYDWHYAKRHIQKDEEGNFACHRCPQLFNQRQVLQIHIKVDHHNQESNKCNQCQMMFVLPSRLEYHIKNAHADSPQFSCEFCGQKFTNRSTLKNHRTRKHTSPEHKVFCDQCGKGYRQPHELKVHIARAHSTGGEYICEGCGATFTNQYSLNDHKRMTCGQNSKPSKPGKAGKPQSKKHICQYCGAKFHSPAKRECHEKSVHLNIRDIMCDECDYRTANAYKLRCHKESIHEGIVYKCDVPGCGRSYRTKGSLYCHQDKNHDIPKPKTIEKMRKQLKNRENTQGDTRVNDQ